VTYSIELANEAESDLENLYKSDRKLFRRILSKIETLSTNPKSGNPLVGNHKGEFSLRVGNYRIVYELDTARHIILILTVKHRKHVY
jgi:mRNA interferase RelE/StbE